jgi:YHS domain-containing protein
MVRFLLTLFLIIGINYLMGSFRRRIFSRPAGGPARTEQAADSGDELVQDPNCLTYLSKKNALTARTAGATHHFCSPECADAFEKKRA